MILVWLEFELDYYNIAVDHVSSQYVIGTYAFYQGMGIISSVGYVASVLK